MSAQGTVQRRRGGVPVRLGVWLFHLLLPLVGLWLLLAVPAADLLWEHHPSHFWLVFLVALLNVALAVLVDRAARRHDDARLMLIGLGFLAAALFFALHAVATPGVLLGSRNGGFALATPVGLVLAAVFTAVAALDFPPARAAAVLRAGAWLPGGLYALTAVWGVVSLAGLPPLADPGLAERLSLPLIVVASVAVLLYLLAAVRFYLVYRRRRSVMLLSLITASMLLAESMVAVMLATSWHLTWWLWHVLMVFAFGYVGYSAYVTYQREGATVGLFDGIGTEQTVQLVRAEYGAALEALVSAVRRQESGEISADEMALITAGMASRFGLSEGQTAVLGRAAGALRNEREQIDRLGVLVAIGHESRVRLAEQVLLRRAVRRVGAGFDGDGVRIGLIGDGKLRFPDELSTDSTWVVPDEVVRGTEARLGGPAAAEMGPVVLGGEVLACPLTVKDRPAGVLLSRRSSGFSERDRSLFASLASQLSMGMENARLYHQLDGLFRQYMSPDVATALLADPEQAALGGAVVEVTALFADLRGFTTFSERSSPGADRRHAQPVLRGGDRGDPGRGRHRRAVRRGRDDGAVQRPGPAARPRSCARPGPRWRCRPAVEPLAAATPGWPRFRVGINTGRRWSATSAATRCATSTPWATR